MVTTDVLSWDELQNITANYDRVFVMAFLPDSALSDKALKVFEELSRKVLDARFLQFDSTTKSGLSIVKELGIRYAPMTFAFRDGVQVKTHVGEGRTSIESVIRSIVTLEEPQQLDRHLEWPDVSAMPLESAT
ncbi:hypothetical protein NKR23_g9152 [Pleurostoma richardsiae]|uniref:Thioredoxin domain-containing protein n=1 Tax=Pleurostoma richardsiae TaxID=41990 RepID=A0AA38VK49_9PEZI|nr:hypothetical protein NKR23_g9152 [Pleurostoma richardsiae]